VYSEDYIIRLIQQLVAFIAHITRLNRNGEHDKALAAVERTWGELFDVPREMLDAVDTPSLVAMLREPAKIRLAAQLFVEEGRALAGKGDPLSAAVRFRRALELFLEARAGDPAGEVAIARDSDDATIQELLRIVPRETLAPRYRAQA
jgi:hypothetical protein